MQTGAGINIRIEDRIVFRVFTKFSIFYGIKNFISMSNFITLILFALNTF
jgi:hypothetical protein